MVIKARPFAMFHVSLMLVFFLTKLINTLVEIVDLLRFCPEFRAFRSIMRQILVTKTTNYAAGHGCIRDMH